MRVTTRAGSSEKREALVAFDEKKIFCAVSGVGC
jgi:hypothetical protein